MDNQIMEDGVARASRRLDFYLLVRGRGATADEGQGLLCPSQYTWLLGAEVHEQMSRSGGQSEAKPPVFSPQAS
ncbi:hypothetical protein TNCV_3218601 [Trichonephila clavipes]|nr:hypothetical protein TNCV_3218601 [Trichonephila clavipes]